MDPQGVRRVVLGGPRRSQTLSIVPIYTPFKEIHGSTLAFIDTLGVHETFLTFSGPRSL